jgi:hypothetical protein
MGELFKLKSEGMIPIGSIFSKLIAGYSRKEVRKDEILDALFFG